MREIKFRMWYDDMKNQSLHHMKMTYDPEFISDYNRLNNLNKIFKMNRNIKHGSVLMQYTGLKDTNGKEIYEGDILKLDLLDVKETMFDEVRFYNGEYKCYEHVVDNYYSLATALSEKNWHIKIAGNIYENPELLEK